MGTQGASRYRERRRDLRLASTAAVEAVVLDRFNHPVEVLRQTELLNVSASGLALVTLTPTDPGVRMAIQVNERDEGHPQGRRIYLETLECSAWLDGRHKVRCRLLEGRMPARFIYKW